MGSGFGSRVLAGAFRDNFDATHSLDIKRGDRHLPGDAVVRQSSHSVYDYRQLRLFICLFDVARDLPVTTYGRQFFAMQQ